MLPSRHVIISFSLGAMIYYLTRSIGAGLACLFSGVLVDVDHIIDFIINSGPKGFSFKEMYWTCIKLPHQKESSKIKKVYLVFHAWEIVFLLWLCYVFSHNIYVLSLAIGYTSHLLLDTGARAFHPLAYSLVYRLKRDFKPIKFFHARFL